MLNSESVEKMQTVVDSLRSNPDVVVGGGIESNYLETGKRPFPDAGWSRTLDIYTHPVEPIYKADELNEFMFGLVPELKPSSVDKFFGGDERRGSLQLGMLYYDEVVGTVSQEFSVQLRDDISLVTSGLLEPEWTTEEVVDLRQRTWVRVFPDAGHLADAAEGTNKHFIPTDQLGKTQGHRIAPNLLQSPALGAVIDVLAIEA